MVIPKKFSNLPLFDKKKLWNNETYLLFFLKYLKNHMYIKPKDMIRAFFIELNTTEEDYNEYYRRFLVRQYRYISITYDLGYLKKFSRTIFRRIKKIKSPAALIKELKKIKFKA